MPSFMFPNLSFYPTNTVPQSMTPTSGSTVQMHAGQPNIYITNLSALASLTVKLPGSPYSGMVATITSQGTITALTVQNAAGVAVVPGPASNAAGATASFLYMNGAWSWSVPATVAAP
jgi:hypothetical protein